MEMSKQITAIDSHTMGEPTRIITEGFPEIPGNTMAEKKEYLIKNLDHLRTAVMLEPRGHRDMFGSIILPPTKAEADLGIIFMDGGGYLNMCGHGTIGAMTAAVEMKWVEVTEPVTKITFDTPAGIVRGEVSVENGEAKEVSFRNVPSFLYKEDAIIYVKELDKNIKLDVTFAGSFFALVNVEQLGIEILPKNANELSRLGMLIRDAANREISVSHPTLTHIKSIDLVEFYGASKNPAANYQNVVVFGDGQVDRSPCGTGTSAKMATLFAKGQLKENELFVYESIIGTLFKGRVVESYLEMDYKHIIPEITASAYITGINKMIIKENDPLKYGFTLG